MAISIPSMKTLLLSSLLYGTIQAFVPLKDIHPPIDNNNLRNHALPSELELDTARWVPVATLAPVTSIPTLSMPTPTPTPAPDDDIILPLGLDAFAVPELKKRQGAPVAAPAPDAQPTAVGQISPITTYYINSEVAPGSFAQVPVVYTQTFPPVPDQWPSPVPGTIGLGTIQGQIGQVRSSKRAVAMAEPTQAPFAGDSAHLEMEVRKPQTWSA
ncbi:hypothetical protein A1O7_08562 [Cladophialophora yegresii CBS 114405]|uniref:Yeast cell wall synthesis Kre9/Knh1 C-terminal domain-containing protein n=1 Tax=Cladophialophora yegresii CBS 114405 TaxID=1182544 RepID=W9VJF4_9EURO|nr:uncharacterized protein A1O7_08562 [Cladophialophora yegresii CBS 114405]EXJ55633.1 hypothetical protein A1O7_08562 [Cladophialophora yegresii CBS 114405]